MHDLVSKSPDGGGEMCVKIKTESEMSFVDVEVASVDSVFLYVHGLIEQQLFKFFIEFFFFKEFLELFLKMHDIISFEPDS
jgi:hypothetical protein